MSWNYRVIYHPAEKYVMGNTEIDSEEYYGIHEVYYDENGNESLYAIKPEVIGESIEVLEDILEMMKYSLNKKILKKEDFEEKELEIED